VTPGYAFGLDLGNPGEFSALALVERTRAEGEAGETVFSLRDLKRYPPGTPYQGMAADLRSRLDAEFPERLNPFPLRAAPVAVDVTATGREVLDTFRLGDPPPALVPVTLTMGLADGYDEQGTFRTSKRNRMTRLQVLLQAKRVRIPKALDNAELLVKELLGYRPKVKLGTDPAQADWRDGLADDLIFAVALAIWQADHLPDGIGDAPSVGMRMEGSRADRIRFAGELRARFPGRFGR
jgi:hypothetical protein